MTVQPGWYADPAEPTTQRYWDGEGWIGAPLPVDATPPPGPPPEEARGPEEAREATEPGAPGDARESTEPEAPAEGVRQTSPAAGAPYPAPPHPGVPYGQPGFPPAGAAGWPPANGMPAGATPPPGWGYPPYPYPTPPPRPHGLPLASLGARLVARMIDIGILFLLNIVVNGWFVWRFVQDSRPFFDEVLRRSMAGDSSTEGLPSTGQADSLQVVILLIAAALWFAYEVPALANGGQTFGKRVAGIKVVSLAANERLGFGRSLRRWNLLGLPTFLWGCCGIGLLLQAVDCAYPMFDRPLRQALHDKRAQTVVVRLPRPAAGTGTSPADSDDHTDIPTSGGPAA